jgi:hypothetical protein
MQIGNGLDLLGRHGADHREAQAKRGDETQALDQAKRLTAFIEDLFIEDSLELVGHHGKLLAIHSHFLSVLEGVIELNGSCQKPPSFQEVNSRNQGPSA